MSLSHTIWFSSLHPVTVRYCLFCDTRLAERCGAHDRLLLWMIVCLPHYPHLLPIPCLYFSLLSTYCLISCTTSLAFSMPVLFPFWTPVYDLLPAPGPSYMPPRVVLCKRPVLETSSLCPLVIITLPKKTSNCNQCLQPGSGCQSTYQGS